MEFRIKTWHVIAIGLLLLFYFGYIQIPEFQPGEVIPGVDENIDVNRALKFVCVDKYAGSAVTSATLKVYDGQALLESLTTGASDGCATTGASYPSGKQLNILLTKSNNKAWYTITVPKMAKSDVEALTVNPLRLDFFTLDTSVTLKVTDSGGNSYTSGTTYLNFTSLGVSTATLTISGFCSADNVGYISSYDPLNQINWYPTLYGKLSGTNYELLSVTGWDVSYPKGTAMWGAHRLSDEEVTKYKVGNTYVHPGSFAFTVTVTKGGYTGSSATIVLYLYAYSDPSYHESFGSYGPDSVAMASAFTVKIAE